MDHPVCLVYCPLLLRPEFSGKKYLIPSNHSLTRETEKEKLSIFFKLQFLIDKIDQDTKITKCKFYHFPRERKI
jgi:hypothetical protein